MNSKLAILFSLVLASGSVLAGGEQAAMDQGMPGEQGVTDPGMRQSDASFSEVDANADGLISEDEAQGNQQLTDNFNQADANADGYVNRSEYNSLLGEQTLQE